MLRTDCLFTAFGMATATGLWLQVKAWREAQKAMKARQLLTIPSTKRTGPVGERNNRGTHEQRLEVWLVFDGQLLSVPGHQNLDQPVGLEAQAPRQPNAQRV